MSAARRCWRLSTGAELSDEEVEASAPGGHVEGRRSPSIETFLHALCLRLEGVQFVGHTHPTAAVGLLCGQQSREIVHRARCSRTRSCCWARCLRVRPLHRSRLAAGAGCQPPARRVPRPASGVPKVILMENHGGHRAGRRRRRKCSEHHADAGKDLPVIAHALVAGGPRLLTAGARGPYRSTPRRTRPPPRLALSTVRETSGRCSRLIGAPHDNQLRRTDPRLDGVSGTAPSPSTRSWKPTSDSEGISTTTSKSWSSISIAVRRPSCSTCTAHASPDRHHGLEDRSDRRARATLPCYHETAWISTASPDSKWKIGRRSWIHSFPEAAWGPE